MSIPQVVLFYKPVGYITSHNWEEKHRSIFELLPKKYHSYHFVGRLDYNTEGLLLLSNSREFVHYMTLPKNQIVRRYEVKLFGRTEIKRISEILQKGVIINNFKYLPIYTKIMSSTKNNHRLLLTMREGKNREIRKIMSHLDLKVAKIKRVSYGKFALTSLKRAQFIHASEKIIEYYMNKINERVGTN
ncbi:MAG: RNA pseudouridylate synthase family protein [Candidatus Xenolissoclinum pacificiensis L6]|uniref:Pseudouridine synthase n=1 Tax=Candidatus Xenolissoclinum pacificiensis L6 TaxID=1401685 RepID=W2UZ53_9RICK|nr:MAG: RNA pseudouridylate synthase family protein [Candidatus Xenolissoclinum pacificiensis L6]